MKFCYCPSCQRLRPRNWYARSKCEDCGGQCVTFEVKRSAFGWLMYILDAVAVVLIVLHASWYQWGAGWASFYSSIPQDVSAWVIFGLIFLSIVLAFVDIAKATKKAEEMVSKGIMARK